MDGLVDSMMGYLFTFIILCLLVPVMLVRPVLMLLAHLSSRTATLVQPRLARRRVAALGVLADRGKWGV